MPTDRVPAVGSMGLLGSGAGRNPTPKAQTFLSGMQNKSLTMRASTHINGDMTLIARYKNLPEAHAIPEIVYTVQNSLDELVTLDARRKELQDSIGDDSLRMMETLKRDWSDDELKEAGLMAS